MRAVVYTETGPSSVLHLVDLPDLDSAIAACAELPHSYTVEIRPEVDIEGYEPPRDL